MHLTKTNHNFKRLVLIFEIVILLVISIVLLMKFNSNDSENQSAEASGEPLATMQDYWNGKAEWKLYRTISNNESIPNQPAHAFGGSRIIPLGDTWYLFHAWEGIGGNANKPDYCQDYTTMKVRSSTDKGLTWSDPVDLLNNNVGTPWECSNTDGDAFFDEETNTWHLLFQCMARIGTGGWQTCHASRSGTDPMGQFTPTSGNPVARNRDIWNEVCRDGSNCDYDRGLIGCLFADCTPVGDEGTFDIIEKKNGFFYVSFHGARGVNGGRDGIAFGYRGIVKTSDFRTWIAGDPNQGVPFGATHLHTDTTGWRENWNGGNKGFGAGSTIKDGDYYYQILESFDVSIVCKRGQNWNWGIYRTNSLAANSGQWQQLPEGNPIYYSNKSDDLPCNPAYGKLFKDPVTNKIYFHANRSGTTEFKMYIYELKLTNNQLKNADFWKCNTENWQVQNGSNQTTNMIAYRNAQLSTDGNCYMAMNCGGNCQQGQSIYQEVDLTDLNSSSFNAGIKILSEGSNGTGNLVVSQMNNSNQEIKSDFMAIEANETYRSFKMDNINLEPEATKLRFSFRPTTSNTFRLDEAFISPTVNTSEISSSGSDISTTQSSSEQNLSSDQTSSSESLSSSSSDEIISNPSPSVENDIYFIFDFSVKKTPEPETDGLAIFGDQDFTYQLKDDKFTANSNTSICSFQLKELSSEQNHPVTGFKAITQKLTSINNDARFDSESGMLIMNYDPQIGCNFSYPSSDQDYQDYELRVRVAMSNGEIFGRDDTINMLFGAFSQVTVSGEEIQ